jgi:tetratricopeptide (TPR) repeat protein
MESSVESDDEAGGAGPSGFVPAEGRIEALPVPALLHRLLRARATGTLTLSAESLRHELSVVEGRPVSVTLTGDAVDPLGRILLQLGKIGDADYQTSLVTLAQTKRKHGQILKEMGAINEDDIRAGLEIQLRRKLNRLFQLAAGTFSFEPGAPADASIQGLDPLPVILNGIRSTYDEARLDEVLRPLVGLEARLRPEMQRAFLSLDLLPAERFALGALEHFRTLDELTAGAPDAGYEVRQFAASLLLLEALELRDAAQTWDAKLRAPPIGAADSAGASPFVDRANHHTTDRSPLHVAEPNGEAPPQRLARIVPNRVEVPREEPNREPETHVAPPAEDDDEHRMPPRPVRTVRPPPPKAKPDRSKADERAQRGPVLTTKKSAPKEVERPPTPDEIDAALGAKEKVLKTGDYFALLEIDRDASADEVKQAYFKLAKRFHPDRFLSNDLRNLRRRAEAVFERISEAHDALRSEDKRREYVALLADPRIKGDKKRAQTVGQADAHFMRAQQLISQGEWAKAEETLRRAIDLYEDDPEYHAALGWVTYQNPQTTPRSRRTSAIKPLLKALQLKADHERSHLTLGRIYELEGLADEAVRHYQKVLEVNGRNNDAAQALGRLRPGGR